MSPIFKKYGKAPPQALTWNMRYRRRFGIRRVLAAQAIAVGICGHGLALAMPTRGPWLPALARNAGKAMAAAGVTIAAMQAASDAMQFGRRRPDIKIKTVTGRTPTEPQLQNIDFKHCEDKFMAQLAQCRAFDIVTVHGLPKLTLAEKEYIFNVPRGNAITKEQAK